MSTSLLEVWGDTVDSRHLGGSIGLGLVVAGSLYLVADEVMPAIVDDDVLAHSYALLVGLLGCLLAGFVAARLFPAKRHVVLGSATSSSGRFAAMDDIEREVGPLGDPRDLTGAVQDELRSLDLFDDLLAQHEKNAERSANGEPAVPVDPSAKGAPA